MFTKHGEDEGSDENQWKRKQSFKANSMEWRESRQFKGYKLQSCAQIKEQGHTGACWGQDLWTAGPSLSYTLLLVELTAQKLQKLLSRLLYWALVNFMIIYSRPTSVP